MNHARLLCLGCVFALTMTTLGAQQLSLFTQYRENATLINPAALESDYLSYGYNMNVGATYRKQWTGVDNSPETATLRFNWIDANARGTALHAGGYLINDETGPTAFTGFYGRVGTVLGRNPEKAGVSVGLSAGYVNFRVKASELVLRDANDPIATADQSQGHPDVGFGVYAYKYTNRDNLIYGGISVPQVLGFDVGFTNEEGEFNVQRLRHYYATAGWYYFTGQTSFLEVSSWVKYVEGAPLNADLTLRYQLPTVPYVGAGIATSGDFHFEAGLNVGQSYGADSNFRVGYAYNYSFNSFGPSVGGTHELQIAVALER